jgi:hypothetical protein
MRAKDRGHSPLHTRVRVRDEDAKGRPGHRRASRHRGPDYRSAGVVAGGAAVEPVRPSANKSQRRVSSKNCSLTFGSF